MIPVGITRDGVFVLEDDDPDKFALDADKLPEVVDNGTRILWPEGGGDRALRVRRADGTIGDLGGVDVVLPILHGVHGEDGTVQGFLDTLEIPYAGGGVLDSALCMDKHFMKIVLQAAGVPVSPWVTVTRAGWARDAESVRTDAAALGLPLFVKPARAGSSVGVSKVAALDELEAALAVAFAEDDKVLIETAIVGREVEVAILEGRGGAGSRASLPGEIVLTTREFYDFEGKYLGGDGADVVCPADLTRGRDRPDPGARHPLVRRGRRPRAGAGGFLPRRRHPLRQRAEHDARIHADLDVPEVLDRLGHVIPRTHLGAHRHGAGARRRASRR